MKPPTTNSLPEGSLPLLSSVAVWAARPLASEPVEVHPRPRQMGGSSVAAEFWIAVRPESLVTWEVDSAVASSTWTGPGADTSS